ncbi:MAG: type II secretion system protein M [Myxococcaceae bacterium]|nr:type II secretion system protein M [Myxococcaceae bacterium]
MEQLRVLINNVTGWFAQLSTREKRLVTGTGAAVGVFILFLIFAGFQSAASRHRRAIETGLQNVQVIEALAANYRESERERQSVERQLSQSNLQLISYLEDRGEQAGLRIGSLNPKGEHPLEGGQIHATTVEVNLSDVTIDKLVNFLSSVERGPGVIRVERIRLDPRPDSQTINASTTISTYSMKK